jgi:hypothetical protein
MKIKTILFVILAIALVAVAGCIQVPQGQTNDNTINVQGTSEITVKPDKAEVWVGISIVNSTAAEAQNQANIVINKIIDGLRYKGFNESNIQTDQLSLYEERIWDANGVSKVIGWRATQTLKVKTTDLTKVGTIVDVAVNSGANQIQNIQFGLSDQKEKDYKSQALTEATTNAREKAETIAQSLGVKLGTVKTVSESNYYSYPYVYSMKNAAAGVDSIREASSVLPSDVSVSASISIVYTVGK